MKRSGSCISTHAPMLLLPNVKVLVDQLRGAATAEGFQFTGRTYSTTVTSWNVSALDGARQSGFADALASLAPARTSGSK
ncbi:predicted protein [Pyrenophora tritici-repentis Pt-1C-BFP]|uniref:Uncharacterized protein n=2 Tax=Pyrenophora tritici-repentis TaxID=45151 RepID=B2VUC9_PYRTR|nr:uncharacterized protein PTRG_02102 [Pyrenophora tritici-repentis Pt-1C-BFP]EDU41540.1 predicted protein [Pyrenophora tritici-repentis Pt-1C-BFP]